MQFTLKCFWLVTRSFPEHRIDSEFTWITSKSNSNNAAPCTDKTDAILSSKNVLFFFGNVSLL